MINGLILYIGLQKIPHPHKFPTYIFGLKILAMSIIINIFNQSILRNAVALNKNQLPLIISITNIYIRIDQQKNSIYSNGNYKITIYIYIIYLLNILPNH